MNGCTDTQNICSIKISLGESEGQLGRKCLKRFFRGVIMKKRLRYTALKERLLATHDPQYQAFSNKMTRHVKKQWNGRGSIELTWILFSRQ